MTAPAQSVQGVEAVARAIYEATEPWLAPNFWEGWKLTDFAEADQRTRAIHIAMAEAVVALPREAPAAGCGLGVKALKWPVECPIGQRVHSYGGLVRYCIAYYGGDVGSAIYRWGADKGRWSRHFATYGEAQNAAQSDYEARIRSALFASPAPAPEAHAGLDALMRAIRRAEDGAGTLPAKEAVKLRPADWHAVCRLARALASQADGTKGEA